MMLLPWTGSIGLICPTSGLDTRPRRHTRHTVARVGDEAAKFTSSCSFSMNTNVNTVCGLSVGQLGVAAKECSEPLTST